MACPRVGHGERMCAAHGGHHDEPSIDRRAGMQWPLVYLMIALLTGAIGKRLFPPALPYTVGLLLVGIAFGVLADALLLRPSCPWQALVDYDANGDGVIERAEWGRYLCEDCDPDSLCAESRTSSRMRDDPDGEFSKLDSPLWYSPFYTERDDTTADDGLLQPDELWIAECNLFDSIVDLSRMDPHLMLVVFLPTLLFESAFALDISIFMRQSSQILLLALPGVLIASLLTSGWVYMLYPWWPYNTCLLLGAILSATDPVAVVALLKELGAAKTLGTLIEGESLLNDGSAVVLFEFV